LVKLDALTARQRRGRTGRTANGTFRKIVYNLDFESPPSGDIRLPSNMRSMVLSGLPVEIAASFSRDALFSAFGYFPEEGKEVGEQGIRNLSAFLANFKPVVLAALSAKEVSDPTFGEAAVIHHTGGANVSSSFPQPDSGFEDEISILCGQLLHATADPSFKLADDLILKFDRMAGPILKVGNLFRALVNGDQTDVMNPKNNEPTGTLDEVYALRDIYSLLRELETL